MRQYKNVANLQFELTIFIMFAALGVTLALSSLCVSTMIFLIASVITGQAGESSHRSKFTQVKFHRGHSHIYQLVFTLQSLMFDTFLRTTGNYHISINSRIESLEWRVGVTDVGQDFEVSFQRFLLVEGGWYFSQVFIL